MAFLSAYFAQGPLSALSVNRGERVPTNTERRNALRACMPIPLANPYPWPYLQPKALPSAQVVPFRKSA